MLSKHRMCTPASHSQQLDRRVFSVEFNVVWINVLQRYSLLFFLSQIQQKKKMKNRNYHPSNHTRLFLVSSLEKLNYRRRSIRLFALLLDATAYWRRIILVLSVHVCARVCVCVGIGVGVWSTGDDGQGMVQYMHGPTQFPSTHTHISRSFSVHRSIHMRCLFRISLRFLVPFFLFILSQSLSQHKHMYATDAGRQTDKNWSHQLTHDIHHYHERELALYLYAPCVCTWCV